jgi:hypothetical protein
MRKRVRLSVVTALSLAWLGCGEGGNLAISAGAPVTAVVRGTITKCGTPIPGAEVVLRVRQAEPGQAQPVDTEIGPETTDRRGEYLLEVAPPFAVPGPAVVHLRVVPPGGALQELPGRILELGLGRPARDTLRLDADLGIAARVCP